MTTTFIKDQTLRHLDLNILGVVESEVPIGIHTPSLRREMVNVRIGEFDNIWWDTSRVIVENTESVPVVSIPLTAPASDPAMVIA